MPEPGAGEEFDYLIRDAGSQNPQDNVNWGLNRVDVPGVIGRFMDMVFGFPVTAPATPGTYNLQWRMVRDGVEWFGEASENIAISVATPEPAECASIRSDILRTRNAIDALRAARNGLDPKNPADRAEIREIHRQISELGQRIAAWQQRSIELGCG